MPPSSRASASPRRCSAALPAVSWRAPIRSPTSLWIGGLLQAAGQSGASAGWRGRPRSARAHRRHHDREFHQRHRHRDVRRLFVGAVPQSAAHGDAICAADRARRRRAHLFVVGRRLHRRRHRLGAGSSSICALAAIAEPMRCCGGCKASGHFKRLEQEESLKTTSAASSPPTACLRRDNRVRRRPARHAPAASPSRRRRPAIR